MTPLSFNYRCEFIHDEECTVTDHWEKSILTTRENKEFHYRANSIQTTNKNRETQVIVVRQVSIVGMKLIVKFSCVSDATIENLTIRLVIHLDQDSIPCGILGRCNRQHNGLFSSSPRSSKKWRFECRKATC